MNTQKGFSLIELMIVVAILSIVLAIAVPNYQDSIEKSKVTKTADLLNQQVVYARSEALRTNKATRIVLDSTKGVCAMTYAAATPTVFDTVLGCVSGFEGVTVVGTGTLAFDNLGVPTPVNFTISSSYAGAKSKILKVNPIGIVSVAFA